MAYATVAGHRHNVRVVQDLADNWSLEIYPAAEQPREKTFEPFKNWPVPLCLKVRADSREDALSFGLEHLKKLGQIEDFHLEPGERPVPPPPKAAANAPAAKSIEGGDS
jgi:hypothetical protein